MRGHCLLDLFLHGIEVERCSGLHRWELDGGLRELGNDLLNEYEAPEFVLEPTEVMLRSFLGPVAGPSGTLKGIEAKVGKIGYVRFGFITQPTSRPNFLVSKHAST